MKRRNPHKESFLGRIPDALTENVKEKFQDNISFSLQFFDKSQSAGQDFRDWTYEQLHKLLDKLKEYCKCSPKYWQRMAIGGGRNHVLEIYGKFPVRSDFTHPKFVPLDVDWARFRLEGDMRLIGFFVSKDFCSIVPASHNTFYIVFLDKHHRFFKSA